MTDAEKLKLIYSGEYGAFELYDNHGNVGFFRGYRKGYGTTKEYLTYGEALDAALEQFSTMEKPENE